MFVVIRSAGMAMGPPLGVRRVIGPQFPLEITLTDADSMIAERKISLESEIRVQARISLDSGEPVELVIDQRVE